MTFGQSIKTCFSKYVTFSGRATRSEYWWFALLSFIVGFIPVVNFLSILLILPGLAVAVRRLHDVGKSGWNLLWAIIPLLGALYLLPDFVNAPPKLRNAFCLFKKRSYC